MTTQQQMSLGEAIGVARRTLAEHYNLTLIDGKMHGDHVAANAYNVLASTFWYYGSDGQVIPYAKTKELEKEDTI